MANISQDVVGSAWFYRFHRVLHTSKQKESILVAIALTTGIPINHFIGKFWHEFIVREVNGRYTVPKILYRNELHKLPWIVVDLIKRANLSNNLPVNKVIEKDYDWNTFIWKTFVKKYFPEKQQTDFDINFTNYPQILFGRQILIKNGYSNKIGKFLKSCFGIKLNSQLEEYLHINKLSEFKLNLKAIDLYCPDELFVFKDKGFGTNRDYYNFLAFDDFLMQCIAKEKSEHARSIYVLIILCFYNGLRPAFLKDLHWKDFVEINEGNKTLKIPSEFNYRGKSIMISNKYAKEINRLCPIFNRTKLNSNLHTAQPFLKAAIQNYMSNNPRVFLSPSKGPLQLQSLKRDIQKTLKKLEFPHWNLVSTLSFQRMWGRRILEINGDHKLTIKELKAHFNFKSKQELFVFLDAAKSKSENSTFKNKRRDTYSDYINYSMEYYIHRLG